MSTSTTPSIDVEDEQRKKYQLLKKAVIALTKQKQDLESSNKALEQKLVSMATEFQLANQTENALRRELEVAQAEIAALKKKGAAAGAASVQQFATNAAGTLKGLLGSNGGATVVNTGNVPAAQQWPAASQPTATSSSSLAVSHSSSMHLLTAEDQQRMFEENESLHIQMFEIKSELEQRRKAEEQERRSAAQRETRLTERIALLEANRAGHEQQHDELSLQLEEAQSKVAFCLATFRLAVGTSSSSSSSSFPASSSSSCIATVPVETVVGRHTQYPPELVQQLASRVETVIGRWTAALSAVSVWIISARDHHRSPATSSSAGGGGGGKAERLQHLLDAHLAHKERLTQRLRSLGDVVARDAKYSTRHPTASGGVDPSQTAPHTTSNSDFSATLELELLLEVESWLALLATTASLLVASTTAAQQAVHVFPQELDALFALQQQSLRGGKERLPPSPQADDAAARRGFVAFRCDHWNEACGAALRHWCLSLRGACGMMRELIAQRQRVAALEPLPPTAAAGTSNWMLRGACCSVWFLLDQFLIDAATHQQNETCKYSSRSEDRPLLRYTASMKHLALVVGVMQRTAPPHNERLLVALRSLQQFLAFLGRGAEGEKAAVPHPFLSHLSSQPTAALAAADSSSTLVSPQQWRGILLASDAAAVQAHTAARLAMLEIIEKERRCIALRKTVEEKDAERQQLLMEMAQQRDVYEEQIAALSQLLTEQQHD